MLIVALITLYHRVPLYERIICDRVSVPEAYRVAVPFRNIALPSCSRGYSYIENSIYFLRILETVKGGLQTHLFNN
jgi:hypothetical protein